LFFFATIFLSHAAEVDTLKVPSLAMNKTYKTAVVLPSSYKKSTSNYPVMYLLHGAYGHFSDWLSKTPNKSLIHNLADQYNMIIVMPEGETFSFYLDSPVNKGSQFETYITQEVIQKIFGFDYQIVYLFKDLLFEEQMKESNGIERKQEKDKQYPSSHSSSTEHVPSHSEVVMSVPRLEKKGISMYEKKMKKVINSEYLPQSVKKITLLFPGTTYIKEE
jgi:hypothetical protein